MPISNSRLLVIALRHDPMSVLGVETNLYGYVPVSVVLDKLNIDMVELQRIHDTNEKRRFQFNDDKTMIRATQGHTIPIVFDIEPSKPPKYLFHRTHQSSWEKIKVEGLSKMKRHHVHLTPNQFLSKQPVILEIDSEKMYEDGFEFINTMNNVWLVDNVPAKYIKLSEKIRFIFNDIKGNSNE